MTICQKNSTPDDCNYGGHLNYRDWQYVCKMVPLPCVDLAILEKETTKWKILLITRRNGYEQGKLCMIGGRVWLGETLKEALDRQADQLGIKVKIIPPFSSNFSIWRSDNPSQDKTKHCITDIYPAKKIHGKLKKEGDEFSECKWYYLDDLPKKKDFAFCHYDKLINLSVQLKSFASLISL